MMAEVQQGNASTLATRVKAARLARGLSQTELAKRSGIVPSQISHYETGTREPGAGSIVSLCKALGCSADYLLGLTVEDDAGAVAVETLRQIRELLERAPRGPG